MNPFRTTDGRLRGLRIVACIFLFTAALNLYWDGWRSLEAVGSLLMALGLFGISLYEGKRQSDLQKMHLAVFAISVAVVVVGLGLKFLDIAMR